MHPYLPGDLEIEGVDVYALKDIMKGLECIAKPVATLPVNLRSGLLAHYSLCLEKDASETPPMARFVIAMFSDMCRDPKNRPTLEKRLEMYVQQQAAADERDRAKR